jgi:hypothetical protein
MPLNTCNLKQPLFQHVVANSAKTGGKHTYPKQWLFKVGEPIFMTIHTNKCIKTARTMRNINVNYATEHLQP